MLDPNYLQYIADELVDDFAQLESDILSDIARRIKENNYSNTSTANFQKEQLKALGMSNTEIQRRLSEILKVSKTKVSELLSKSVYESIAKDNQIINEAYKEGLVSSFSFEQGFLKDIILNGIQSLNVELKNICNTTAITSKNMLYQAMNKAYLQIQSGAFSSDVAIDNVIRDLSKQGISMVDYESGAHRRLDSVVRNAVRTSVNKTACEAQEKNLDEQGVNLVETTSHWGARPSHAEWQGKVFYRNKKVKGYKNFYDATGYGKGSGLGGWNCRHSFYPFYEGLSEQSFEHFNEKENEDYYDLTQQQRYNERMIREWKRRRDVCKAGGVDATREAHKLREWNARNKKLLKANPHLKRNFAREKTFMLFKENKLKEYFYTNNENVKIKVNKVEKTLTGKKFEKAYIFDSKGNIVLHKGGLEHEVEFTLKEIKKMKNCIAIHNHPMNTPFSPDDLYFAVDARLQEIRVVTKYGVHSIRRNENLYLLPSYDVFSKEYNVLCSKYSKIYILRHKNWRDDIERYQRTIQSNAFNEIVNKYGLDYRKGKEI